MRAGQNAKCSSASADWLHNSCSMLSPAAAASMSHCVKPGPCLQVPGGVLRSAAHGVDVTVHRRRTAWSLCLYSALLGAVAPLHRVLDALSLGLGRLDSLSFARCSLASAALQPGDVGQLAALRVVKATNCTACAGESLRAALERLLAGCPKLNSITPSNCGLTSLPEGTYVSGQWRCTAKAVRGCSDVLAVGYS